MPIKVDDIVVPTIQKVVFERNHPTCKHFYVQVSMN